MGSGDNRLLHTWKLRSWTFVDAKTAEQSNSLRIHPVGYLNFYNQRETPLPVGRARKKRGNPCTLLFICQAKAS